MEGVGMGVRENAVREKEEFGVRFEPLGARNV